MKRKMSKTESQKIREKDREAGRMKVKTDFLFLEISSRVF